MILHVALGQDAAFPRARVDALERLAGQVWRAIFVGLALSPATACLVVGIAKVAWLTLTSASAVLLATLGIRTAGIGRAWHRDVAF